MNERLKGLQKSVQLIEITSDQSQQRLDNFLISKLKGVPKTRIYRIVRKGEVRVNKKRVGVNYRLHTGDIVRIPPVVISDTKEMTHVPRVLQKSFAQDILYEDEYFLVLNKPAGFAVHGGSGLDAAIIEALRKVSPTHQFLELVHRLDRDTSGCLIIAKKRSVLRKLHEFFRGDGVKKTYLALLAGQWTKKQLVVNVPLEKKIGRGNERQVIVSKAGKNAETLFTRIKLLANATLVEARPKTGRTHQIRVHASWLKHPIIGDSRYGDFQVNRFFSSRGYKRMFLHAYRLEFIHPISEKKMIITAPMPEQMRQMVDDEEKL